MKLPIFSAIFLSLIHLTHAADVKEKNPADLSKGKVYEWKSADGLIYHYRIPKSYNGKSGASLTFILHGSNLTHTWGFANHQPDTFRPDDIVVCPDGTTSNGQGGFNFLGKDPDVERFAALQTELKSVFKIDATYLYGHSQGSFFALHYAGAKPDDVQGVVAHASGVWTWTNQPEAAHHQAIVLMHGTQDPVVSYGQSVGGYESFKAKNYPTVRMRSLEGWNHWPAEHNGPIPHTSQQLAWVEGMTSTDLKRLAATIKTLSPAKSTEQSDFAALYQVAERIANLPDASAGAKSVGEKTMNSVDILAEKHISEFAKIAPNSDLTLSDEAWIGHLPMFLRAFAGVPKAEEFCEKWAPALKIQTDAGNTNLRAYYAALRADDNSTAFSAGLKALQSGFLSIYCTKRAFLEKMESLADSHSNKGEVSEFKSLFKDYTKALADGQKEFESINKKATL
jgi:predicted esterase